MRRCIISSYCAASSMAIVSVLLFSFLVCMGCGKEKPAKTKVGADHVVNPKDAPEVIVALFDPATGSLKEKINVRPMLGSMFPEQIEKDTDELIPRRANIAARNLRYAEEIKRGEKIMLGEPLLPVYSMGEGRLRYNALVIGKDSSGNNIYRFNFVRNGVHTVVTDFTYEGEPFKIIARGEEWCAVFTNQTGLGF